MRPGGGTSAATRAGIAAQVLAALALALAVAAALTWLSGRPGLRVRLDVTADARNTLDPELAELIRNLPASVKVEVFFRQEEPPAGALVAEAQSRFAELLFVADNQVPGKLEVIHHDLTRITQVQARMAELDLKEVQTVVIHSGNQRAVLRLWIDIARFELDPSGAVPPRLVSFRGEEALATALLKVSTGGRPKLRFLTGHGERNLYGTEQRELGRLQTTLVSDGFEPSWWDPLQEPAIPPDTAVLAVIDPQQVYPDTLIETIRGYVAGGGRLLVAPSSTSMAVDGRGSIAELLRGYGIQTRPGIVARPVPTALGQLVDGVPECGVAVIPAEGLASNHPVTEPLWRAGVGTKVPYARAFHIDPQAAPKGAILTPILRSGEGWLDLPASGGVGDWKYDPRVEEGEPYCIVAVAASFPPVEGPRERQEAGQTERLSGRVLALGSADMLINDLMPDNQALLLNSFNWLAEREWRLTVRPRDQVKRKLDVETDPDAMSKVTLFGTIGLPGLCALLGVLLAWKRRR